MSQNRNDYQASFLNELARLNPAQRAAVEQIEGPVLVIAGPGTGKTHILSARIGKILLETDTSAQSILCLTFTEAGVRAMRQRLLKLIGPEAHRVHIYTFHAFCNTVIQDNLAVFGRQGLEAISELEQVEIIRELLEGLPIDNPLRRGKIQSHFYEKHLRDLFQLMKTEGWSTSHLQQTIKDYLQDILQRPEFRYRVSRKGKFQKGDLKTGLIQDEERRMEVLGAAAALFPAYEQSLARNRRYDFADMIGWVLRAFREQPQLLRRYQEQYLYFLVDEYQDTNGAQNELIQQLTTFWDSPNLFIVGDDDQSIFEFQGARLKNLTDYYYRYQAEIKVVVLTENYRSTQPILDGAKRLIDHNEQRITNQLSDLGVAKDLSAALPARQGERPAPKILQYPNRFQEAVGIIEELERQHVAGVPWQEMAIIYARHQQVQELQQMLDKRGIPYQTKRRTNILDSLPIRQLREMLRYLADEQQQPFSGDHRLFRIVHYACFGLKSLQLARLAAARAALPYDKRLSWREWLQTPDSWPANIQDGDKVQAVGEFWEGIHLLTDQAGLVTLCERLLNGSGLLKQQLAGGDRLWQIQLIKTFLDFIRAEVARRPRLTLRQFLLLLEQMDGNRIALPLRKDIELDNGVHLVTAHSSKGLEFQTVFLLDATQRAWEGKGRGGGNRFKLPDTLTLSGETAQDETHRRLFYVATTRAKENLFITLSERDDKGKEQLPCRFVDELIGLDQLEIEAITLPEDRLLTYELTFLQQEEKPHLPALEKSAIGKLLEDFQLSVSAWHRLLDCPLSFFYEVVLQVPQIQRPAATYGNAMHNALQRYFNLMLAHPERQFAAVETLQDIFVEEMRQVQSYFPPQEFEQRMERGLSNLARYHTRFRDTWVVNCRTELNIRQVEIDGVPIKGVIDRIDLPNDQEVVIVDYKTGSHQDKKLKPPTPQLPAGGNYWRQLVFYKLLWENRTGETRPVRQAFISYLDLDRDGELTMTPMQFDSAGLRQVRTLLKQSYQQILAQDFYTGCGETDCRWCRFLREDVQPPSHTRQELEELDDTI